MKNERSTDVFRTLKSASELVTIISGNSEQVITNYSKLNFSLPKDSIISFDVTGFMSSEDGLCSTGTKSMAKALLAYKNLDNVIGAKINFDTGGGEGMAGHILHDAIKEFGKTVVAYVYNAGSAGYLAASAAKEIIATNTNSRIGGIGSFVSISNKMLEDYGKNITDHYSDLSSEKNQEFRSLLKGDSEPLRQMLNKSVEIFHDIVKQNRILKKDPEGSLRGSMFFADDAKKRGLIDNIGNNEFALSRIKYYGNKK